MAINNFMNNIKKQTANATDFLKEGITDTASKTGLYDVKKQKSKLLLQEKSKMYEFIGMEVFDLYQAGSIKIDSIEPFCNKLLELNKELAKIESLFIDSSLKCECGADLNENMKFCMTCGKKVDQIEEPIKVATIACACGSEVAIDALFCMECGRKVEN